MRNLSSAVLKLHRAKVHIREAHAILDVLVHGNLCTTYCEPGNQGGYIVKITSLVQPPPEFALAIGDAAHCLRSSLDHIAFAFAKAPSPGQANRQVEFPICSKRSNFVEQRRRKLKLVDRFARARIERFQPYHRRIYPNAKWLMTLDEIDNMDKHRLLAFTEIFVKRVTFSVQGGGSVKSFKGHKGRMEVGAVLASFKPSDGTAHDKVKVKMVVIPVFGLGTPKELVGVSAVNCLIKARNFIIQQVLPAFQALN